MSKDHLHTDPQRLPKLQAPIEDSVLQLHSKGQKQMMVDITKLLVKITKAK